MTTPTTLYYSLKLRDRVSCHLSGPIGLFSYNMTFLVPGSKEKGAWSPQSPKDQWRCITHSWGLGHLLESRWQNLEITWWTWVWVNSWFGDGQGSLVCCNSWGRKESDTTEWLNWIEPNLKNKTNQKTTLMFPKFTHCIQNPNKLDTKSNALFNII